MEAVPTGGASDAKGTSPICHQLDSENERVVGDS
jgi:hypothetical protein